MAKRKRQADDLWIQGAVKRPGALHEALNVPQGQKIPPEKLKIKPGDSPRLKRQKNLARTLSKLRKRKKGK